MADTDQLRASLTWHLEAGVDECIGEAPVDRVNHHNCTVNHRADRYRDATKRHDVRINALVVHDQESGQYAEWQRDDDDGR